MTVYVVRVNYLIESHYEVSETICVCSTKRKAQNFVNKMNAIEINEYTLDGPENYTFHPFKLK